MYGEIEDDDDSALAGLMRQGGTPSAVGGASSPCKVGDKVKEEIAPSPMKDLMASPSKLPVSLAARFAVVPKTSNKRKADEALGPTAHDKDDEQEHEGDDSKPTPNSKGAKKARKPYPCRVCGVTYQDMPACGKECHLHKNDVAALGAQLRKKSLAPDATQETKDDWEKFQELKKTAGLPPSEFSREVLAFSAASPSRGQGVERDSYTAFRKNEKHVSKTETQKKVTCVMMHESPSLGGRRLSPLPTHG